MPSIAPAILSVTNPVEGVLVVRFNTAMKADTTLLSTTIWQITPDDLTIANVIFDDAEPSTVLIHIDGPDGTYSLSAHGLSSADGDMITLAAATKVFAVRYGSQGERAVRLFNTAIGPIGITQRSITRRHIDRDRKSVV